jgi:hypothetical protein
MRVILASQPEDRERLLMDLRAIAALGRGEAWTEPQAERLTELREAGTYRHGYTVFVDDAGEEQRGTFAEKRRPGDGPVREACGALVRFLEARIAEGLAPRLCKWEGCTHGRDGGRRWFLPVRQGEGHKCCCEQCRTDEWNST